MTTPFTTFAFNATGAPTARTLPERLADYHNVKDFGAVGDGVADDLAAIMACINWRTSSTLRGTIYFPPGTYYISGPIDFSPVGVPATATIGAEVGFRGELGCSTIIGNFADYLLRRTLEGGQRWSSLCWHVDNLTLINQAAGGGGIRLGLMQGATVENCDITADICINDDNTDAYIDGGNMNGAFEVSIANCNLRPQNVRATGSFGIAKLSDGPVTNCRIIGFDVGMGTSSGQGGATVLGCYFEGNNIGFSVANVVDGLPNPNPPYDLRHSNGGGGNLTLMGCSFKNNGIAIDKGGGGCTYRGVYIEGASGGTPSSQHGFHLTGYQFACRIEGVSIAGTYGVAGFTADGGEVGSVLGAVAGVGSASWALPSTAITCSSWKACNVAPVFTVYGLPAITVTVTGASWSSANGGTATVNFTGPIDISNMVNAKITITGITPSGYNVAGVVAAIGINQLTFPLASNPGPWVSGGSIFAYSYDTAHGLPAIYEGTTWNVSDSTTGTWGAPVTTGGGSNHVKVRFTSAAWTVVGK